MNAEISYGKWQIPVYRTYATPLQGLKAIPESPFNGRSNILFAAEVGIEVFGDNFMPAYTEGDNSNVVATDTMKNFVLQQSLDFDGSTMEDYAFFLGTSFLTTYQQMQSLQITCKEQPFIAAGIAAADGFTQSDLLFSRARNSYATARLEMDRNDGGGIQVLSHSCGLNELQLIKISGSAFASFARDRYTTLPERTDRPLFIYLNVGWRYRDAAQMLEPGHGAYVAPEQVSDLVNFTFHDFVSMSIQHLIYEMGSRLLARFPQIEEVSFEAQNRLWDMAFTSENNAQVKVYTDPRPPYGLIRLTMHSGE